MKNILLFMIVSLSLISCQNQPDKKSLNNDEEIRQIKQTLTDMWDAIEKEDIDRYAQYVHPDFTQFGEYDSLLKTGKELEVAGIRDWVDNASDIHTEMIDPQVTIRGNTAWIVYYWSDRGTTIDGTFSSRGKSTRIFVKEQGKWLCIHGHYTLLP